MRVTMPSLTATPISLGWRRASHFSSASTSFWICSSLRATAAVAVLILASFRLSLCHSLGASSFGFWQTLDFNSLRKSRGAEGCHDFQHAVVVLGGELFSVYTLRQYHGPLEAPIGELLVQIIHILFLLGALVLAAKRQVVALKIELNLVGVHAW